MRHARCLDVRASRASKSRATLWRRRRKPQTAGRSDGIARKQPAALSAALFLCLIVGSGLITAAWPAVKVVGDARVGAGYDSNVLEFVSEGRKVSDGYALLEAGLGLETIDGAAGPVAQLRWAVERYNSERGESRHILWSDLGWRIGDRDQWFLLSWSGAQRSFPSSDWRDVTRQELRAAARLHMSERGRLLLQAAGAQATTSPGGPSERRGWLSSAEYWQRLNDSWQLFGRLEGGGARYDRVFEGECPSGEPLSSLDSQDDRTFLAGAGVSLNGPALVRLFYGWRITHSNVASLSLQRHEVSLQAGLLLPAGFSIQLLGRWNATNYKESDCVVIMAAEDAEDPDLWERNSLVLQLRRPIAPNIAGELRAGVQRNEALILGQFYDKTILEASVTYSASSAH